MTALQFSPDGTALVAGDGNGLVQMWPLATIHDGLKAASIPNALSSNGR